jgi:prolyl 4-hydroxylase
MWDNDGTPHIDKAYRLSMTAKLDRTDAVIKRIEDRARSFPFYKNLGDFMPIVVQNYGIAGQYRDHYDWFDDRHAVGGNIASTFFVYIHANSTGGGTNFARLTPPSTLEEEERWCEFIDCDRPLDEGVTFKPILGNAIYWENLHEDDSGHVRTLHAGMPVTSGNKMGMNMWTWKTA